MKPGRLSAARGPAQRHGIDRMIANVETGRFERSLSALTAAGALVTAAEIYFEHDSASFGNKMMWVPVVLGPRGPAGTGAQEPSRLPAEAEAHIRDGVTAYSSVAARTKALSQAMVLEVRMTLSPDVSLGVQTV